MTFVRRFRESCAHRAEHREHVDMSNRDRVVRMLAVVRAELGRGVPTQRSPEEEAALERIAGRPEIVWVPTARETLRKRGHLDISSWCRQANVVPPKRVPAAPRSRRGFRTLREQCVACGSILDFGAMCVCRRSENAGRCDN